MKKILLASHASGALILAICRSRANRKKLFPNSLMAGLLIAVAMLVTQRANASEDHSHIYANGFCTQCDAYEPATLDSDGYYGIGNAGQLYWFAEQVNNGETTINAKLTADIVVNENVLKADGSLKGAGFRAWTPIGLDEDEKKYIGTFDGQGHTISGLYINDEEKSVVGLFCALGSAGIVKNVGVIDSYFYANSYSAGICGSNGGTVENCFNAATCKAFWQVAGGIAGWHGGTIKNCYNIGFISAPGYQGAICGNNMGNIINSYYLSGSCDSGEGRGQKTSIRKTLTQFASGEVAWLLNGETAEEEVAWYQNLGENADAYPVPNSSHGKVYHGYDICYLTYSNSPISTTPGAHSGYNGNGFCTKCGYN